MNTNEVTHIFTPYWLSSLPSEEQQQVREWLTSAGVNLNRTPGFDYDGKLITTRYYQINEMGQPMMTTDSDPIFEHQVREFSTTAAPDAVHALLKAVRGA